MKRYKLIIPVILLSLAMPSCKKDDLTHGFSEKTSVSISSAGLNFSVGDTARLSVVFNSRQTASQNQQTQFSWTLDGPAIVQLQPNPDKSVSLEALAEGSTMLKLSSVDGRFTSLCEIIVTKSNRLTANIYVDFGTVVSEAPWNNIQNFSSGAIMGLADEDGNNTGINLEIIDAFNDQNSSGVSANTLGMPSAVSIDAFWGDSGNPTAGLKISNLNKNQKFNFSFYASRTDVTDNRETAYIVKGATEKTVYLNASGNKSNITTAADVLPDADGVVNITVKAGPNNNNSLRYYYLNALTIAPAN